MSLKTKLENIEKLSDALSRKSTISKKFYRKLVIEEKAMLTSSTIEFLGSYWSK